MKRKENDPINRTFRKEYYHLKTERSENAKFNQQISQNSPSLSLSLLYLNFENLYPIV